MCAMFGIYFLFDIYSFAASNDFITSSEIKTFVLYSTHNRLRACIDPCSSLYIDNNSKKISITSYVFDITYQRPVNYIFNYFIFEFNIGFSSIDIWKKELE